MISCYNNLNQNNIKLIGTANDKEEHSHSACNLLLKTYKSATSYSSINTYQWSGVHSQCWSAEPK